MVVIKELNFVVFSPQVSLFRSSTETKLGLVFEPLAAARGGRREGTWDLGPGRVRCRVHLTRRENAWTVVRSDLAVEANRLPTHLHAPQ